MIGITIIKVSPALIVIKYIAPEEKINTVEIVDADRRAISLKAPAWKTTPKVRRKSKAAAIIAP